MNYLDLKSSMFQDRLIDIYDLPYVTDSIQICQDVCGVIEGCKYFTYDVMIEKCYLYQYRYI